MNALYTPILTTIYVIFSEAIKSYCFLIEFFHTLTPIVKYSRHIYELGFSRITRVLGRGGLNIREIPFSPPRRRGPGYSLLNFPILSGWVACRRIVATHFLCFYNFNGRTQRTHHHAKFALRIVVTITTFPIRAFR